MKFDFIYQFLLLYCVLGISSCSKYIENVPVLTIEETYNLPVVSDVSDFYFFDDGTIYASSEQRLYKSNNSGNTWDQILAGGVGLFRSSLAFLNADIGVAASSDAARLTLDGGENWITVSSESSRCGVTEKGDLFLLVLNEQNAQYNIYILNTETLEFEWVYEGISNKTPLFRGNYLVWEYDQGSGANWDLFDLYTYEVETIRTFSNFVFGQTPTDFICTDDHWGFCNYYGYIATSEERYSNHTLDYKSIDFNDQYFVCVGDGTIATDYFGDWKEVYNENLEGFEAKFTKVKFQKPSILLIGNENGEIIKGTIE